MKILSYNNIIYKIRQPMSRAYLARGFLLFPCEVSSCPSAPTCPASTQNAKNAEKIFQNGEHPLIQSADHQSPIGGGLYMLGGYVCFLRMYGNGCIWRRIYARRLYMLYTCIRYTYYNFVTYGIRINFVHLSLDIGNMYSYLYTWSITYIDPRGIHVL